MRVGVLTTSYPRFAGDAAGNFVAGLNRELARRGAALDVLCAGPGVPCDEVARIRRLPSFGLFYDEGAPERLGRSRRARLAAPLFAAGLAGSALAAARRWDLVVSHWLLPCGVTAAWLGRPHLAIAHSGDVHLAARPGLADAVAWSLTRPGTRVAFVAEHLRQRLLAAVRAPHLRRRLAERSLVCAMGTEVTQRGARPANDRPLIACLARLVPIKGIATLIDATARLGARLVVAGAGPLAATLAAHAARRQVALELPGELAGAERDALLARADVVCVPSVTLADGRSEGAPTVVVEALAAGVPLVASDLPGIRELAGGAAWLVPPGDAAALADALTDALANPERHAAAARTLAARHRWSEVADRLGLCFRPSGP